MERGDACIYLCNNKGYICRCILKMLYIYQLLNKYIFSTNGDKKWCVYKFWAWQLPIDLPNRAVFNITHRGRLYYLKNIFSAKNATHDLHSWHKILCHCNESDIKKLFKLVKGMKIKLTPKEYLINRKYRQHKYRWTMDFHRQVFDYI